MKKSGTRRTCRLKPLASALRVVFTDKVASPKGLFFEWGRGPDDVHFAPRALSGRRLPKDDFERGTATEDRRGAAETICPDHRLLARTAANAPTNREVRNAGIVFAIGYCHGIGLKSDSRSQV